MGSDLEIALNAATVALNLAIAIALGATMSALWMLPSPGKWVLQQRRRLRLGSLSALLAALLASGLLLWLVSAAMAEVRISEAADAVIAMLTQTHLGLAWKVGAAALAVSTVAAALSFRKLERQRLMVILLGLATFLYSRSMVSHASANGDFSVQILMDWVHLILISVWVGEVFTAGFLTLSRPAVADDDRLAQDRYVDSLSTSATFALVGIFATGLISAWYNLQQLSALRDPYGMTLLVKLALVAAAALLGGYNRFFVMPSLLADLRADAVRDTAPMDRFVLILRIEAAVLLGVLVLAAILSSTSPPAAG